MNTVHLSAVIGVVPMSGQHSAERCKLSLMVANYPSTRRAASQNAHGKTSCAMAG
jgi:hypothetical protein